VDVYHVGKQIDPSGDQVILTAKKNGIITVAYSSFSAYPFVMKPVDDPIVKFIAKNRGTSPGQVILRWILQHEIATIPRSSNTDRLRENLEVLSMTPLTPTEMHILDTIQYLVDSPVARAVHF
jgi:diketogulonate reductase-like aldo/keto reductase